MKIFVACCFDGNEPWSLRRESMKQLSRLNDLLQDRGFQIVNFSSLNLPGGINSASTEDCVASADAVIVFRGRTMLGASERVRELAQTDKKPVFEFIFQDYNYPLPDFTSGRNTTWPWFQQIAITEYEEVFYRLSPSEVRLASRAL